MTEVPNWSAPPHPAPPPPSGVMPPPPPLGLVPPPPVRMPAPVPGTGASSHFPTAVPGQLQAAHPGVYSATDKSIGLAYLLWFFLGLLGVHQFYLGKVGRGVGYLLTGGWLTIGLWVDLFTLPRQIKGINAHRRAGRR